MCAALVVEVALRHAGGGTGGEEEHGDDAEHRMQAVHAAAPAVVSGGHLVEQTLLPVAGLPLPALRGGEAVEKLFKLFFFHRIVV